LTFIPLKRIKKKSKNCPNFYKNINSNNNLYFLLFFIKRYNARVLVLLKKWPIKLFYFFYINLSFFLRITPLFSGDLTLVERGAFEEWISLWRSIYDSLEEERVLKEKNNPWGYDPSDPEFFSMDPIPAPHIFERYKKNWRNFLSDY
jgi:hypothetical protein